MYFIMQLNTHLEGFQLRYAWTTEEARREVSIHVTNCGIELPQASWETIF